jgi:hypothetical protein
MISTKWFNVTVSVMPREFLQLMRYYTYDRSRSAGFDLAYANERAITGRFIEEVQTTTTYTSPLGEEITNHLVTHKIVSFSFHYKNGAQWLLRVNGNPRSLKSFARYLSDILNFRFSIESITTPALDVLDHLVANGMKVTKVTSIYAANLPISKGGLGKIEVRATVGGDALAASTLAFPDIHQAIERMTVQLEYESHSIELALSRNAGVTFDEEFEDTIATLYMTYLNNLLDGV